MEKNVEAQIGKILRQRGLKIATAESCTGGLIGHRITNVPGSSDYYQGGVVAYANAIKTTLLGVSPEVLTRYGAVSRETVMEMAHGARQTFEADLAISVSGIAGPTGGTDEKPVGTVWVGLSAADGKWARLFHFRGNRQQNKASSGEAALQMLLDYLEGDHNLDSG